MRRPQLFGTYATLKLIRINVPTKLVGINIPDEAIQNKRAGRSLRKNSFFNTFLKTRKKEYNSFFSASRKKFEQCEACRKDPYRKD